jgi:hypothetical protein
MKANNNVYSTRSLPSSDTKKCNIAPSRDKTRVLTGTPVQVKKNQVLDRMRYNSFRRARSFTIAAQ